ncbi:ROK family protein [Streptomyces longwoodensis]|uniref:ROK family protein n=1 Tax=Streptomyces longwoodensis TaxID=68231 RepID=UPI0033F72471
MAVVMTGATAEPIAVGIDMGGTATRLVALHQDRTVGQTTELTAELGAGTATERVERLVGRILDIVPPGHTLGSVGIGASGPVDPVDGEIHNPATLPAFSGIRLVERLREHLSVPVTIDNDAVVAALGEHRFGAGRGADRLLMITLGTGIGGALLIDGAPLRTHTGGHPEAGHIPVLPADGPPCYCGLRGCWEAGASRTALQMLLGPLVDRSVPDDALIAHAANRCTTDPGVRQAFHAYGVAVGRGLACLHSLYGPSRTVIGGSAAAYLHLFRPGMDTELVQNTSYAPPVELAKATLGDISGALGAALVDVDVA